jgi:hypothetical protein
MDGATAPLPRRQSWVGEVMSGAAIFTVTLMLYGEAALSVVCAGPTSDLA